MESQRSFLRDAGRFFAHLFPGVVGLPPSSLHSRLRKLRRFLKPLRREMAAELGGDSETLTVDSTLLPVLYPRQIGQSAGRGGVGEVGLLLGLRHEAASAVRHQPRAPLLRADRGQRRRGQARRGVARRREPRPEPGRSPARRLLGDLAYRSEALAGDLVRRGVRWTTEKAEQGGKRQQVEIAFASLKREFRLGETLATTLTGFATRVAAKLIAYTCAFLVNRRPAVRRGASRSCGPEILATDI